LRAVGLWRPANVQRQHLSLRRKMLLSLPCHMAYYGGPVVRVLSLVFDLMLFSSLAFLVVRFAGNEFAFLPIIFALSGVFVQAIFLRRFGSSRRRHLRIPRIGSTGKISALAKTKICQYCDRAISVDAKICRFCLTEIDERSASSAQVASQTEILDLQRQSKRWQAASNADL
jgi:hypothetical protein